MLQIGEPKFKIGDIIIKEFTGQIEGIEVKVRKTLFVSRVQLRLDLTPIGYEYGVISKWPLKDSDDGGLSYSIKERDMPDVDPLVNAIVRAQAQAAQ